MRSDTATRIVLAALPICLVVLLVGGCGQGDAGTNTGHVQAQGGAPGMANPPPSEPPQSGSASSVRQFTDAISNPGLPADMRAWVAEQLGKSDEPAATEALIGAAGDPEPEVAAAALNALQGRRDDRIRGVAETAKARNNPAVQRAAADLLQSLE